MSEHYDNTLILLDTYRSRARVYVVQRASYGDLCPPYIITQLQEVRREIQKIKAQLIKYYGVTVEDEPGTDYDVDDTITVTLNRETYKRIRTIVARYGFDLPEIE